MWRWPPGCRKRFVACAALVVGLPGVASAQERAPDRLPQPLAVWHAWLSSRLPGGAGSYDFALAMFTGNLSRDPIHAEAQRRLLSAWLNTTLLPGDTLIVAGAEHRVWTASRPIPIDDGADSRRRAFSMLPAGPDPTSRGGKSIEKALLDLADRVPRRNRRGTAVVMLSNG